MIAFKTLERSLDQVFHSLFCYALKLLKFNKSRISKSARDLRTRIFRPHATECLSTIPHLLSSCYHHTFLLSIYITTQHIWRSNSTLIPIYSYTSTRVFRPLKTASHCHAIFRRKQSTYSHRLPMRIPKSTCYTQQRIVRRSSLTACRIECMSESLSNLQSQRHQPFD